MNRHSKLVVGGFCAAVYLTALPAVSAPEFDFVRIVGTGDLMPGTDWTYLSGWQPVLSGGQVVFQATGLVPETQTGIFTYSNGTLQPFVLHGDSLPAADTPVVAFSRPTAHGSDVVFSAAWSNPQGGYFSGLYQYANGSLNQVIGNSEPVILPGSPSGTAFLKASTITKSVDGVLYFTARSTAVGGVKFDGLYRYENEVITEVLNQNTVIPNSGGQVVGQITKLNYDGQALAFFAATSPTDNGLYTFDGATWQNYGSRADIINELGTGEWGFQGGTPIYEDGQFVVSTSHGSTSSDDTIMIVRQDGVMRIADTQTDAPGGGRFTQVGGVVGMSEGDVLFDATTSLGAYGIYRTFNGSLAEVIRSGDMLDGKTIESLRFVDNGISGDNIAFIVHFQDNTRAMYIAPVVRGSDQIVPIVSSTDVISGIRFQDVETDSWVDSLRRSDFEIRVEESIETLATFATIDPIGTERLVHDISSPLILAITMPKGYGSDIELFADGQSLGLFDGGERVSIEELLGHGVRSVGFDGFIFTDQTPSDLGVPVQLEFSTQTATVVALVPEPSSLAILGLGALCITCGRRRRG